MLALQELYILDEVWSMENQNHRQYVYVNHWNTRSNRVKQGQLRVIQGSQDTMYSTGCSEFRQLVRRARSKNDILSILLLTAVLFVAINRPNKMNENHEIFIKVLILLQCVGFLSFYPEFI